MTMKTQAKKNVETRTKSAETAVKKPQPMIAEAAEALKVTSEIEIEVPDAT